MTGMTCWEYNSFVIYIISLLCCRWGWDVDGNIESKESLLVSC